MKDEPKKGGSQKKEEEAGGKEQVRFGTKAGMFRKTKEMPVYDRPIKVLQYRDKARWRPREKFGSRFKTLGRQLRGEVGFSDGGGVIVLTSSVNAVVPKAGSEALGVAEALGVRVAKATRAGISPTSALPDDLQSLIPFE
jgi:hypothetical protein